MLRQQCLRLARAVARALLAACVGGAANVVYARTDSGPPFPAPGKLVDVGGWRLHIDCLYGGCVVRLFQSTYPASVSGLLSESDIPPGAMSQILQGTQRAALTTSGRK